MLGEKNPHHSGGGVGGGGFRAPPPARELRLATCFAVMIDDGISAGDEAERERGGEGGPEAALWRDVDAREPGRLELVVQRGHVLRENVFPALDQ